MAVRSTVNDTSGPVVDEGGGGTVTVLPQTEQEIVEDLF
jgi:hypothetical protein